MNELTDTQKKEAFNFMNKYEGTDFSLLAIHLSKMFKIQLSRDDVAKLFMEKLLSV